MSLYLSAHLNYLQHLLLPLDFPWVSLRGLILQKFPRHQIYPSHEGVGFHADTDASYSALRACCNLEIGDILYQIARANEVDLGRMELVDVLAAGFGEW